MRAALIDAYGRYDRAAICRVAHHQYREMRAFGWIFGMCLGFAWKKPKAICEAMGNAPLAIRSGDTTLAVRSGMVSNPSPNTYQVVLNCT